MKIGRVRNSLASRFTLPAASNLAASCSDTRFSFETFRRQSRNEDPAETTGPDGDNSEKYVRTREKNRRAQQRFRQRQKAKLQAKEAETSQLQRQIEDMQTQLASLQLKGGSPELDILMASLQAQNQALLAENTELRLLACRLLDENAALQASQATFTSKDQGPQLAPSRPAGATSQGRLGAAQGSRAEPWTAPALPVDLLGPISRMLEPQRSRVFSRANTMPWRRASRFLEAGLPVGVSPGGTGMPVLVKVMSKPDQSNSTVLVQFPPGFVHDYVINTNSQTEEAFILAGSLTDTAFNQTYYPGDYAHVIPGTHHGPYRADDVEGCLVISFTRGKRSAFV